MFVLGIDPGLSRCGYACLEPVGRIPRVVAIGVLTTRPERPLPDRLAELAGDVDALLDALRPGVVAVEHVFFQHNVRTALSVGQASGLVLAAAAARGCEVVQYTPNQVKESVAGWGGAGKGEVGRMVAVLLGLAAPPRPADAADAAALALCHLARAPLARRAAGVAARASGPAVEGSRR